MESEREELQAVPGSRPAWIVHAKGVVISLELPAGKCGMVGARRWIA